MSERQYVAVRFKPEDKRTYTYHNDGPPVFVGDRVNVERRGGKGWQAVEVAAIGVTKPAEFDTKPVQAIVGDGQTPSTGSLFAGE